MGRKKIAICPLRGLELCRIHWEQAQSKEMSCFVVAVCLFVCFFFLFKLNQAALHI